MREVVWRKAYCFYLLACHSRIASDDDALYWKLKECFKANLERKRKNCCCRTKLGGKRELWLRHSPRGLLLLGVCWAGSGPFAQLRVESYHSARVVLLLPMGSVGASPWDSLCSVSDTSACILLYLLLKLTWFIHCFCLSEQIYQCVHWRLRYFWVENSFIWEDPC